mgnify:CR=1 FL=1
MFEWHNGRLVCQGIAAKDLAAEFGTPLYVYDLDLLVSRYRRIRDAFAPLDESRGGAGLMLAYSCKANGHRAILQALAAEGSAFDIVSVGELMRIRAADISPDRVIFAGVGKSRREIEAALVAGVFCFNVESAAEASRINSIAGAMGVRAPIALRLNPEVDAQTHNFITTGRKGDKFGIALEVARELIQRFATDFPHLRLRGFHAHIGSQIKLTDRHAQSLARLESYLAELRAENLLPELEFINLGGGFGIAYQEGDTEIDIQAVAESIVPRVRNLGLKLLLEPGRFIVGPSGALLTSVEYIKEGNGKRFIIVDAAMTELIRPSIYGAYHRILPADKPSEAATIQPADVVGPVCESTDFLAKDRPMPPMAEGEVLAILDAGAYGVVMASNYNTRPRPAEVAIRHGRAFLISPRQETADLLAHELPLAPQHIGGN